MIILPSAQVKYCALSSHATGSAVEVPGLEYQRKLYVKGETYYHKDRQTSIQKARQKIIEMKGQATLLIENENDLTLWYHDKTAKKIHCSLNVDLSQLVAAMRNVGGVQIKEREFRLKTYSQCFIGSEAVDWMVSYLDISRREAVQIGQRLIDEDWIHHVVDDQDFEDEYFFYRFRLDEQ